MSATVTPSVDEAIFKAATTLEEAEREARGCADLLDCIGNANKEEQERVFDFTARVVAARLHALHRALEFARDDAYEAAGGRAEVAP